MEPADSDLRLKFRPLNPITVKGKEQPIPVWAPEFREVIYHLQPRTQKVYHSQAPALSSAI